MKQTIRIAPSLLSCDFARIGEEVARIEAAGADWLHVDVMDGHFVPNLTIGPPVVKSLKKVAKTPLDVHLMITDPIGYAEPFVKAGANSCTFHVEAVADPKAAIAKFRSLGCKVGITLSPPTSVEKVKPFIQDVDLILVMSVNPGFGGQSFMPEMLDKVRQIREWGYTKDLEIDGGINEQTIAPSAAAGANVFVAGNAIFTTPDYRATIARLREIAQGAFV